MKPTAALEEVSDWFRYRMDRDDEHLILSPSNPMGDCEDFALTVLFYIADQNFEEMYEELLRGRAAIVFCYDPLAQKHNVLRWRNLYTDNQLRRWVTEDELKKKGYTQMKETPGRTVVRRIIQGRKPSLWERIVSWLPYWL